MFWSLVRFFHHLFWLITYNFMCGAIVVNTASAILSKARKPVIVIGSQTLLPPIPADTIRQSLEVNNILNTTTIQLIFIIGVINR